MASDTPENLGKALSNENKFQMRIAGAERDILDALENIPGIKYVKSLGRREEGTMDFIVESEPETDVRRDMFYSLAKADLPILSMQNMALSLEEVFLEVTRSANSGIEILPDIDEDEVEFVGSAGEKETENEKEADE